MNDHPANIVRTTTLEMLGPPAKYPSLQTSFSLAIMAAPDIPLPFYKFLYNEIGREHYWFLRRHMSDLELEKIVHGKSIIIKVLYCNGAPAGFAELDISALPEKTNLVYFGLMPQFIGRGLGKWFLGQIIHDLWEMKPGRIVVSTDSLDHPHALPTYQKMGFSPISFKDEALQDWLQH